MKIRILTQSLLSLTLLAALGFLSSCATGPEIKYESDKSVDLTAYKTYVVVPFSKTKGIEGADPGSSLKYATVIANSLRNTLGAKGFTEATSPDKADFAVNVGATVVPKTDVTDWGMGYAGYGYGGYGHWGHGGYWGGGMGYNVTVDQYNEGVLRIEIYSTKTKELVWVGWARDEIYRAPDDAQIAKAIDGILQNFPLPAAPAK